MFFLVWRDYVGLILDWLGCLVCFVFELADYVLLSCFGFAWLFGLLGICGYCALFGLLILLFCIY